MTRPWTTIERVDTAEGALELRRRGETEFLITIAGRVLMTSAAHRSEDEVARLACAAIAGVRTPRVLIGGLGMGYTLRAALDALPADARVTVAELTPHIVAWCRGPMAQLTARACDDPRVTIRAADVAEVIRASPPGAWHAIVLDLYEGPNAASQRADDPFYGSAALARTRAALAVGGVLAIWSEDPDAPFERRVVAAGLALEKRRVGGKGARAHVVYMIRPR